MTQHVRDRTREELYRLIRARGEVTRAGLATLTGLSRSTINQSVSRLLRDGRITELDARAGGSGSGSGRPATTLRVVAPSGAVAGIDFGHNHVYVALGDAFGAPVSVQEMPLDVDLRAAEAMDAAADLLAGMRQEHGVTSLSAVVAGIPGPVDVRTGEVRSPTILSGWVGMSPARELEQRLGTPVQVENDALLGALGEARCGAGQPFDDFLYVKASHGIGAGVIIGRRPFRGSSGLAGEIGHTHLPGRTELCRCGNRGCLEAVVSVQPLKDQIAHTRPGVDPSTIELGSLDDPIATRILDEAGRLIGGVLGEFCNLLNPAALIIGGELGSSGRALVDGIEASVKRHAQPATAESLQVLPASLGTRAELMGALQRATTSAVD